MLVLLVPVVVAGIGAVMLMDRASRSQAQDTTALELAQGELEDFQATAYSPPTAPFTSTNYTRSNYVTLALDKYGTSTWTAASVVSKVQPVVNGHLVTVTVSFTNYNKKVNLQLQSLVNKLSAGQP